MMDAICPQLKPEKMPKLTKKDMSFLQKIMNNLLFGPFKIDILYK